LAASNGLDLSTTQGNACLKFFQQEVVMRGDPIDSSISLPGGGRIAARILLRIRFGRVRGLPGHGVGIG